MTAIAEAHGRWGHVQEVIVQNFLPKPGTAMHQPPRPARPTSTSTPSRWRGWCCRPTSTSRRPPTWRTTSACCSTPASTTGAGSPRSPPTTSTPNGHGRPCDRLRAVTEERGFALAPRLTVYPHVVAEPDRWLDPALAFPVMDRSDAEGLGRDDPGAVFPERTLANAKAGTAPTSSSTGSRSTAWYSGADATPPTLVPGPTAVAPTGARSGGRDPRRRPAGQVPGEDELTDLFSARGPEVVAIAELADELRREAVGDVVTYVRNRNINYTNVCTFKCRFCGFSKGPLSLNLRGTPYLLTLDDIAERSREAWERGATEVCLQGGIHPDFDGDYYVEVARAVKAAVPDIHVHGFTALEVTEGARRLGRAARHVPPPARWTPGCGPCRAPPPRSSTTRCGPVLCPDKITTDEWLECHRIAHSVGLRSNVTIMFGVDRAAPVVGPPPRRAPGPCRPRPAASPSSCGLPFVHMAAPIYLQRRARRGPDVPGDPAHARRGPHRLPRLDRQHPGVWVKLGAAAGTPAAPRRVQRPRWHAHGREHLPGRRRQPRPGDGPRGLRGAGRAPGPYAPGTHDALPRRSSGLRPASSPSDASRRWTEHSYASSSTTPGRPRNRDVLGDILRNASAWRRTTPTAWT